MNEVIRALKERRSIRSYRTEQVREEDLQQAGGRYLCPQRHGGPAGDPGGGPGPGDHCPPVSQLNAAVMGTKADPFYGAPTVVVVLADQSRATWLEDGSLAMGNLMLAAHALGLGSCWVHRAREVFAGAEGQALLRQWGIQGKYAGVAHCLLGYPDGPLPEPKPRREHRIYRR
ncbi:MAG: nitroreductase family protein [Evtepia gabavorous]